LRSKRLEGWMQDEHSRPSFETRPSGRSSEGEKHSSTNICQGRFAVIRWH
jgi:hypothetical protein